MLPPPLRQTHIRNPSSLIEQLTILIAFKKAKVPLRFTPVRDNTKTNYENNEYIYLGQSYTPLEYLTDIRTMELIV